LVNSTKFIVIEDRTKFPKIVYEYRDTSLSVAFIVYGGFKHASSIMIPLLLRFLVPGMFSVFWDLFLFLSFFSAILFGDVIP